MEHAFLFDSHYALADSYWQVLQTDGVAKLTVMEALRCPPPSLNNGEDNAVFKSLIGTLIKCPGPSHCANPLLCRAGFFQVDVPESTAPTPPSELHQRSTGLPAEITRRTHPDDAPSTFSCRLQWKARRAEIEVLAKQASALCDDAKRIPVLADTTLLRGCAAASAGPPGSAPLDWRLLLCLTQLWISRTGQSFPAVASTLLQYLGHSPNHKHQISLAQFSAYHLRDVIYHLDMLSIARTTKLTVASKDKVENETVDHSVDQGCFMPKRVASYRPLVRQWRAVGAWAYSNPFIIIPQFLWLGLPKPLF